MAISQRTLQLLKEVSLADVITACGGTLKKTGHEYQTHCLWHEDKRPSLSVVDGKGFLYCQVCHAKGDAVDYVGQKFGLEWRDAVGKTADLCGITVEVDGEDPAVAAKRREKRKQQIEKLEQSQGRYASLLRHDRAERIRDLLKARGIAREAATEFGIGFCPDGYFEGRITIPISNHRDELVGWTARATREGQEPKYKNSADSELFQKKELVFNEARAKVASRESDTLVFVEGHLDVISMWQVGIKNVVALQGTAVPDQTILRRLAKAAKHFVLCFDGDNGGMRAVEKFISSAGPMALNGEITLSVAELPVGMDPDEVIRSGQDLYGFISSATSWLDWTIDTWAAAMNLNDSVEVMGVEDKLRSLIGRLRSPALRAHYVDRASRVLTRTQKEADQLAKEWGGSITAPKKNAWTPRTETQVRTNAERRMMRLFIHRPELRARLAPLFPLVHNPALRWLIKALEELRDHCAVDLTPHSVMAVVCIAEPHFMTQLRTVCQPSVNIDDGEGVLAHIERVLGRDVVIMDKAEDLSTHELNPD